MCSQLPASLKEVAETLTAHAPVQSNRAKDRSLYGRGGIGRRAGSKSVVLTPNELLSLVHARTLATQAAISGALNVNMSSTALA
jgi:hypothetical protein